MPHPNENRPDDARPSELAPPDEDASATLARWKWVELALIFCVFFVEGGAPPPHVNETHYLTKAKHYWDPSYCPGDLFLDSFDAHLAFYWSIGWLTVWLPLPAVAWIGRATAWGLLAWSWRRLSVAVVPRPLASVLGAALWVGLIQQCNFAGAWVVGGVEAKCFAYALVLLGLEAMVRGQWTFARRGSSPRTEATHADEQMTIARVPPWVWFGIASSFHVLVGGWAVIAAFGVYLLEPRRLRPPLPKLLPSLAMGGACALPGLLPALLLNWGTPPNEAAEAARIYVFDRLRHHLAPLTLPAQELQRKLSRFAALLAVFAGLLAWLKLRWKAETEVGAADRLAGASPESRLRPIVNFAAISLMIAAVGLAIEAMLDPHPLLAAKVLRFYWFRQSDVAVPLAVALLLAQLASSVLVPLSANRSGVRRPPLAWQSLLATAVIAWAGWYMVATVQQRGLTPTPPADRNVVDVAEWTAACDWIRQNVPADAIFLVPRHAQSFKWYAHRGDVANWKDIPQDAAHVVAWRQRCRDLFERVDEEGRELILSTPERLGTKEVRELAQQYGATHVIARLYPPLDLPRIYPTRDAPNTWYAVYAIEPPPRVQQTKDAP